MQIEDDGQGFDVEQVLSAPNSSGLTGMPERVSLVGGTMTIESSPGRGTRLIIQVPIE